MNELPKDVADSITHTEHLSGLKSSDIEQMLREREDLSQFAPDGICQVDPRSGDRVLYNSARARRPHDNSAAKPQESSGTKPCVICEGKTTPIIDRRDLSEGFTFINENLFPMLFPGEPGLTAASEFDAEPGPMGMPSHGLHFLQWTSSRHDRDWQNMPLDDLAVSMKALGDLEEKLLRETPVGFFPCNSDFGGTKDLSGHVCIIKNYGRAVGGSLEHGHQQIAFSNVMPRKFKDNLRFEQERGECFTKYLLRDNPEELCVKKYGSATLMVPHFMRRPYEMILAVNRTEARYIHELDEQEQRDLAQGWSDATTLMLSVLKGLGRDPAYNVLVHNGPGAGLYIEFLPYTQDRGGYERFGLFISQGTAPFCAGELNRILGTEGTVP